MSAWATLAPLAAALALHGTRLLPVALLCPFLGGPALPTPLRAALAFGLGACAWRSSGGAPFTGGLPAFAAAALGEAALGAGLAFLAAVPFEAARAGGRLVDTLRGATLAELHVAPLRQRESATGDLLAQLLLAAAASAGGARLVVGALLATFAAVPAGTGAPGPALLQAGLGGAADLAACAFAVAAPAAAGLVAADLALAAAARAAPGRALLGVAGSARAALGLAPGGPPRRRDRRRARGAGRALRRPSAGGRGGAVSGREPPSPRRLRKARDRGEVAVSRELCAAAALGAGVAALAATARGAVGAFAAALRTALAARATPDALAPLAAGALALLSRTALPVVAAAALGCWGAGLVQTRGLFAPAAARFLPARLRPFAGLRQGLTPERLGRVALSGARVATLGALAAAAALRGLRAAPALPRAGLSAQAAALVAGGRSVLACALAALAAAGLVELALARAALRSRLSTTRAEALRERREDEGDPALRAERQRRHRALAFAPPLARATCLVVNPVVVAVALHHDRASEAAPVVLAKGRGAAAGRLRRAALRAGVPIVEDVPLARALHRLSEVGDEIPPELYDAAAALLVHLYGRARAGEEGSP